MKSEHKDRANDTITVRVNREKLDKIRGLMSITQYINELIRADAYRMGYEYEIDSNIQRRNEKNI